MFFLYHLKRIPNILYKSIVLCVGVILTSKFYIQIYIDQSQIAKFPYSSPGLVI